MKPSRADANPVAYCGLYCGACDSLARGRCPGCHDNEKASWCKVRACCMERGHAGCGDCTEFPDPGRCTKFDNFISRLVGLALNSSREACIAKIRELGPQGYAQFMHERGLQKLPRRGPVR